jgi:phosphoribosylglycinamide formyltransferase 2
MLDGDALDKIVAKHQPDFIVPEIEAIRTERFTIMKSRNNSSISKSGNFTMNRKAIRDLAAKELGLKQPPSLRHNRRRIHKRSGSSRNALRSQTLMSSSGRDSQL